MEDIFKNRVEKLLISQKSKLISITPGSTNQRSNIKFVCVKCDIQCIKQWGSLQQIDNDGISAYCKVCARKKAKESHAKTTERKKLEKLEQQKKMTNNIEDESKERYCKSCNKIHPIEYFHHFQTGKIVNTCKIVRIKKSKTKGNAQRKFTVKSLKQLLLKDNSTLVKVYYLNKVERVTMKTWTDIKCGECDKVDKKRVDAIVRTGGYCKSCANNKASVKKSIATQGVKREPMKNRNEEYHVKQRAFSIKDVENLLKQYSTVLVGDDYDERVGMKQKIKFVCATKECPVIGEKSIKNIKRGGCFCKSCTAKEKSDKISRSKIGPKI